MTWERSCTFLPETIASIALLYLLLWSQTGTLSGSNGGVCCELQAHSITLNVRKRIRFTGKVKTRQGPRARMKIQVIFIFVCDVCLKLSHLHSKQIKEFTAHVLHHHHPSYLEKWQACILSYEIFISCKGEEKNLPLNFSLFCLNQTMLA